MTDDDNGNDWTEPNRAPPRDSIDVDDIQDARDDVAGGPTDDGDDEPPEIADDMVMIRDVTCDECAHYPVCALVSGIRPMLQQWQAGEGPDSDAPLRVEDMAKICPEYIPAEEVEDLRQGRI